MTFCLLVCNILMVVNFIVMLFCQLRVSEPGTRIKIFHVRVDYFFIRPKYLVSSIEIF